MSRRTVVVASVVVLLPVGLNELSDSEWILVLDRSLTVRPVTDAVLFQPVQALGFQ